MHALDRPLVLGLMALEQQFISPDDLVDAFRAWREQPDGSLAQILASRGKLSNERFHSLQKLASSSLLHEQGSLTQPQDGPASTQRDAATSVNERAASSTVRGATSVSDRHPGGDQSDVAIRFKPLQLHAQGGLGQVFLAEDLELHRHVALKEIRQDAADEPASRERFLVEAKVTGSLEHPGIVPVYGLGAHADGRPFYAMRFIRGQTLAEAIKKLNASNDDCTSLEFRQLLARLVSVCNAVAFAHSRGIVHRDLKPQNIMLGPFGETLVVDWGLAKSFQAGQADTTLDWRPESPSSQWPSRLQAERESVTAAGELVGTPAYMSPEQARGNPAAVGPHSDIYGLGAILYSLITCQAPRGSEGSELLDSVREGKLLPPRQVNSRVPGGLAAICQKAMAREPGQRYRTALELAADVERWLADERPRAYHEPWTDTVFRWMRRHRLPVAVTTVLLAVTFVALAVGYVAVSHQRDIADAARRDALAANQRAQDNAAATRQVIEQYLLRVGDEKFSSIPGFEGVRMEMANLAVERYRDLLKQQPDDASLVADAGMAMRRSANLYRMVGQYDQAESLYAASVTQLKKATTHRSQAPKAEQWLGETLCDQALLVARVRGPKAAIAPMREALEIGKSVQIRQPTSVAARQVTARVEGDLADLLRDVGQFDEAIRLARSAAAVQQEAADQNRRPIANRLSASLATINLGETLRQAGRLGDAEQVLNQALERTSGYAKQSPAEPNLRFLEARCRHELALTHTAAGDAAKARNEIGESAAALGSLADDFPKVVSFRRKLGQVLTDSAQLDLAQGELDRAAQSATRSIAILEGIEGSFTTVPRLLASAQRVAAEVAQQRKEVAAARNYVAQAQKNLDRARETNPDSPTLAEEAKRLDALAAALGP